jgi:hypothetical protein
MLVQIGNKVKFLNEQGEGIVKRFINKTLVAVEVEEGFEIPVPVNQLVLIPDPQENPPVAAPGIKRPAEDKPIEGQMGIFLAFEPHDVFSSSFDVHVINNCRYDLLFTATVKQKMSDIGLAAGVLPFQSSRCIYKTTRAEIDSWQELYVQVLFHKTGPFRPIAPVDKTLPVKGSQFSQVQLLKKAPLTEAPSYLFTLADVNDIKPFTKEMVESSLSMLSLRDKLGTANPKSKSRLNKNLRVNPKNGYMEVDLHIEELTDEYSGLSNAEMLNIQLQHCRKAMETAITAGAGKITVIHGVGNGTLKTEVRNLLRGYNVQFYDAPYEKFGYGATEVLLK